MKPLWIVTYLASAIGLYHQPLWTIEEIPFVPTPIEVVDRMLELTEVKTGDIVYDLRQRRRKNRDQGGALHQHTLYFWKIE